MHEVTDAMAICAYEAILRRLRKKKGGKRALMDAIRAGIKAALAARQAEGLLRSTLEDALDEGKRK